MAIHSVDCSRSFIIIKTRCFGHPLHKITSYMYSSSPFTHNIGRQLFIYFFNPKSLDQY